MANYTQLDTRNPYSVNTRVSRINDGAKPTLASTLSKIDDTGRTFSVNSFDELNQLSTDYISLLSPGNLAVLFDVAGEPVKMYVWTNSHDWKELPSLSVSGPVLTEGTPSEKGLVQFAAENESAALKAVQANDPRLGKRWLSQATAPINNEVLWIDTSTSEPTIKWHDGTDWKIISNRKMIDDLSNSLNYTLSSKKINDLINSKAASNHGHLNLEQHAANTANPHNVRASQLTDLQDVILNHVSVKESATKRHTHNNKTVVDSLTDVAGELHYKASPVGRGDMLKSVYDILGTGVVDKATTLTDGNNTIDVLSIIQLRNASHTHANQTVLDEIQEPFTTVLKDKIANVEAHANNYTHPTKHLASIITQDENNRFVTDANMLGWADKYTKIEVDEMLNDKISKASIGVAGGLATLNPNGTIPVEQIPMTFKETKVAESIGERDLLNKYSGLRVFVTDASEDVLVGSGSAEYVWTGTKWVLISGFGMNNGSMKFLVDETNNKLIIKVKYANGSLKTGEISLG